MLNKKEPSKPEVRRVQGVNKVHSVYIRKNKRYIYALGVVEAFPAFFQQYSDETANIINDADAAEFG